MIIDSLFPILACLIALFTPKNQYKLHNQMLAALFIFVFAIAYLGQAKDASVYDGAWYDIAMFLLYSVGAATFYLTGGRVQSILCSVGAVIIMYYGAAWAYENGFTALYSGDPENNIRYEALITLYTVQLLAAFRGMAWSILCKMQQGGYNGIGYYFNSLWHRFLHRD